MVAKEDVLPDGSDPDLLLGAYEVRMGLLGFRTHQRNDSL